MTNINLTVFLGNPQKYYGAYVSKSSKLWPQYFEIMLKVSYLSFRYYYDVVVTHPAQYEEGEAILESFCLIC